MNVTRRSLPALGLVGSVTLLVYLPVLTSLVRQWASDDNYSHGFLVAPFAVYFAWLRRRELAALPVRPHWIGLGVVAGSLAVLLAGRLGAELFLARVSLIGLIAGTIVFLYGGAHLRVLAFPIGFLLLMVPLPAVVFNQLAFPLQLVASRAGETVLAASGIPVLREGNILMLPTTTLEVVEACSGIRSLVSLLTLALILGKLTEPRLWARVALAVLALPVAIVANAARVAGTGLAAEWISPQAAEGFFHEFSGWVMFVVAFALLLAGQRVLAMRPRFRLPLRRPRVEAA
ncbi:MAG TPA: exosortase A [Vicinamibacterales bacterium]|nr:exosortase A [Vicinamibacterales bacterium]